jgi:hypothetical protein
MRYITEFKISQDVLTFRKGASERVEYNKQAGAAELGNLIASKVGWEEKPDEGKHFRLEVIATSFREWELLKEKITNLTPMSMLPSLQKLFSDFESGRRSFTTEKREQ